MAQTSRRFWVAQSELVPAANPASGLHLLRRAQPVGGRGLPRRSPGLGRDRQWRAGLRSEYHASYYAAFAIDPDGWRIEAYHGD